MRRARLIPLLVGILKRNKATFVMGSPAQSMDLPVITFLIQAPQANILVDTGTRDPKETPPVHGSYKQTQTQRPLETLARLGLRPDDIDIVINTHLHWDHCSNNDLFPNAKFYVQRAELSYAVAPLPAHAHGYEAFELGLVPPFVGTRFEILEGDQQITHGVSVLFTPGHTPGSQSVLVTSGKRACLLAGDNIPLYENLEGDQIAHFKPSTIYVDLESYYRSVRRILGLGVSIIPGHEMGVIGNEQLFG